MGRTERDSEKGRGGENRETTRKGKCGEKWVVRRETSGENREGQ